MGTRMYQATLWLLAAGQQTIPIARIDYKLEKGPASTRVTPGRCAEARGDGILICGRRDRDRAITTMPPPPNHSPDTQIELSGGTLAPEATVGYRDGWPDRRIDHPTALRRRSLRVLSD